MLIGIFRSAVVVAGSKTRKPRVAAIDDDHGTLRLISLALGDDYEVIEYSDPRSALDAFEAGDIPDLVVSDVMMPQMVGFDLHERARLLPQMRSVPFLFLSAMSDRVHQRRGMSQGADDYITKPFRPDELRDAVRARLARADSLRGSDEVLEIASLGGLGLSFGGRRLQWEARKAVLLLLYLLQAGRLVALRDLLNGLWRERVQDNTVRVLINRTRRMLAGIAEIRVEDETAILDLEHPVAWDARTFEDSAMSAIANADPVRVEAALTLYTGEFLPDSDAPWAEEQRAHYENLYLALLDAAVELAESDTAKELAQARLEAWYGG